MSSADSLRPGSNRQGRVVERMLQRIIGEDIELSSLSALPLRKVRLQASEVVEKARLRAVALQPALQLQAQIAPGLVLDADEGLLSRALDNLLDNARKYGNGSPVEVEARLDGALALLAVRDHGPGIPEREISHVFDPFFRGEGARGTASGFGLGLALARRVAEAHGGSATALNVEGGGARIELRFPAAAG